LWDNEPTIPIEDMHKLLVDEKLKILSENYPVGRMSLLMNFTDRKFYEIY